MQRRLMFCLLMVFCELTVTSAMAFYSQEVALQYKGETEDITQPEIYGLRYRLENWELSVATGSITSAVVHHVFAFMKDSVVVPKIFLGGGYFLGIAGSAGLGAQVNFGAVAMRLDNYFYVITEPKGVAIRDQLLMLGLSYMW